MQTFPKPLTPGEERACLERLQEWDREARDILIERNLRLVAHVAKKYQGTDYEQDDLLSVGTIGLIKAQNAYNPCFILPYSDTLLQEQKSNIHSVLRLTCLQFRKCLSLMYRNFDFCFRFRYNIAEH